MKDELVVFGDEKIRRAWHEGEWFFSVVDVVGALSESVDVRQYIKKMRKRDLELGGKWGTICTPVESVGKDGRNRAINCANLKGIFRIIQSIPSKRAEPFKLWLAKVGSERIDEIRDPELMQERMKRVYEGENLSTDLHVFARILIWVVLYNLFGLVFYEGFEFVSR